MNFTKEMLDNIDTFVRTSFHTVGLFERVNEERQWRTFQNYNEGPISFPFQTKAKIDGFAVFDKDGVELVYDEFSTKLHLENGDVFKLKSINMSFGNTDGGGTSFI